jgi:UDP-3-O-[3-hydroxymyristoyl] glucosamine N-acyltransferase
MLRATLHEQEIRRLVGSTGDGNRTVHGVVTLDEAEDGCLFFINRNVTDAIRESLAGRRDCIVIAPPDSGALGDCVVVESPHPRVAISKVLSFIRSERRQPPLVSQRAIAPSAIISPLAVIEGDVEIGDAAVVEPFCVVGPDVRIARGAILRAGVHVFPHVEIGEHSVIGANSVIGHDGYGFVREDNGNKTRMPHLGGVIIGSHVDIGALTTVPAGMIAPTIVEDYAKIDDHVHVAHNVRVARNASVTAGVIIGGHAVIETEDGVGDNASIREGRRVGAHALVGMDTSLQHDLPPNHVARAAPPDVKPRDDDDRTAIGFAHSIQKHPHA